MITRTVVIDEDWEQASSSAKKSAKNKKSRQRGKEFENLIETACEYYSLRGVAEIEKTPEARQVVGRTGNRNSQMICVNAKKAQPDFKGTLSGGRSVVFEAKHTDDDRIQQSRVTDNQVENLLKHKRLGAEVFVLVSFGMRRFFRGPLENWLGMKELYGRKYITPEDCREFEVSELPEGILDFIRCG